MDGKTRKGSGGVEERSMEHPDAKIALVPFFKSDPPVFLTDTSGKTFPARRVLHSCDTAPFDFLTPRVSNLTILTYTSILASVRRVVVGCHDLRDHRYCLFLSRSISLLPIEYFEMNVLKPPISGPALLRMTFDSPSYTSILDGVRRVIVGCHGLRDHGYRFFLSRSIPLLPIEHLK